MSGKKVAVIGVGLIGGSIGLALRRSGGGVEVRGYDIAASVLGTAKEMGALTYCASSIADAVSGAQICFIACPVGVLARVATDVLEASQDDCVVSDVGSTKRSVVESLSKEQLRRFIGGHPLAGAEASGVEHARADLFDDAVWYLTPTKEAEGVLYERLYRAVADLGARPQAIDAETHDRLVATVSHLPHMLANVLVCQAAGTLAEEGERLPVTGPSFRDMTRVAGSNPAIWTDIFISNSKILAEKAEEHAGRLKEIASALRSGDREAIDTWVKAAARQRMELVEPQFDGGKVFELRVSVPNKPGTVAEVALALGEAGVNIVDMALHPAPDMKSGAISLWVAGEGQAQRAQERIADLGFPVAMIGDTAGG